MTISTLGKFIWNAMLACRLLTRGNVDGTTTNASGTRASVPAGNVEVCACDIVAFFPFGNSVVDPSS
ncbi:hypothetical protein DL93DRAFT_2233958 [Clavulina sp. PMI_390]|nr:hypothetical protein DL93DRAFT_2233958 [Clavulina sp. PMI_390]